MSCRYIIAISEAFQPPFSVFLILMFFPPALGAISKQNTIDYISKEEKYEN